MPTIDPPDDGTTIMQYWTSYVKGQWRGWWYEDSGYLVMHVLDVDDTDGDMAAQKAKSLQLVRLEIVKRYGADRVIGEVDAEGL